MKRVFSLLISTVVLAVSGCLATPEDVAENEASLGAGGDFGGTAQGPLPEPADFSVLSSAAIGIGTGGGRIEGTAAIGIGTGGGRIEDKAAIGIGTGGR